MRKNSAPRLTDRDLMKPERGGGLTKCSQFSSPSTCLRCLFVPAAGSGGVGGGEGRVWGAAVTRTSEGAFLFKNLPTDICPSLFILSFRINVERVGFSTHERGTGWTLRTFPGCNARARVCVWCAGLSRNLQTERWSLLHQF